MHDICCILRAALATFCLLPLSHAETGQKKRCADARKRKAVKQKENAKRRSAQLWKNQTQDIQAEGTLASLLAFVMPYLCAFGEQAADLQSLELFAGKKAISRATQKFGFQACALDKTYSSADTMDICTENGFRHALQLACRLMPGSTCWAAPVCSSWVWVSRSSSRRSATRPEGDTKISWVSQGNLQVKLTVTVLLVAFMRGAYVYVEQPCSSIMELFEPMTSFVKLIAKNVVWPWAHMAPKAPSPFTFTQMIHVRTG